MANPNRQAKPDIEKSVQELHNKSFDREFDVLAVESLVFNPATNSLDRMTQGGSSIATGQITVASTATLISAQRTDRKGIVVINNGTSDVFVGSSGVTTSNGLLLLGVKGASIVMETTAAVYGIVASGTSNVTYMEIY